jgi:hypothetical protein
VALTGHPVFSLLPSVFDEGASQDFFVGFRFRRVLLFRQAMTDDGQLLQRYARDGSEAAFGELVTRHIDHGKVELKGGSKEDRLSAHEWISMFWHEAVVGEGFGRRAAEATCMQTRT